MLLASARGGEGSVFFVHPLALFLLLLLWWCFHVDCVLRIPSGDVVSVFLFSSLVLLRVLFADPVCPLLPLPLPLLLLLLLLLLLMLLCFVCVVSYCDVL